MLSDAPCSVLSGGVSTLIAPTFFSIPLALSLPLSLSPILSSFSFSPLSLLQNGLISALVEFLSRPSKAALRFPFLKAPKQSAAFILRPSRSPAVYCYHLAAAAHTFYEQHNKLKSAAVFARELI